MKNSFVVIIAITSLFTYNSFAQEVLIHPPERQSGFLRVLEEGDRKIFEVCEYKSEGDPECWILGNEEGYSNEQLVARVEELRELETRNDYIKIGAAVIVVGAGLVATGKLTDYIVRHSAGRYNFVRKFMVGAPVALAGMGVTAAGAYLSAEYIEELIDGELTASARDLGEDLQQPEGTEIHVEDLPSTVNALSFIFMGI